MKLKNKKTGEVIDSLQRSELILDYDSLAELNAEWEDYEEPKKGWYLDSLGKPIEIVFGGDEFMQDVEAIGNYFETKEEAEKAIEKLKAWKRLKYNGFKFTGWDRHPDFTGDFRITASDEYTCDDKDLDLLFGGEE